jgi:hypothetical protein
VVVVSDIMESLRNDGLVHGGFLLLYTKRSHGRDKPLTGEIYD